MGFLHENALWRNRQGIGRGAPELVMAYLSKLADKQGKAWPSIGTIARMIRRDPEYTRQVVRKLEDRGYLKVTRRPGKYSIFHVLDLHEPRQERMTFIEAPAACGKPCGKLAAGTHAQETLPPVPVRQTPRTGTGGDSVENQGQAIQSKAVTGSSFLPTHQKSTHQKDQNKPGLSARTFPDAVENANHKTADDPPHPRGDAQNGVGPGPDLDEPRPGGRREDPSGPPRLGEPDDGRHLPSDGRAPGERLVAAAAPGGRGATGPTNGHPAPGRPMGGDAAAPERLGTAWSHLLSDAVRARTTDLSGPRAPPAPFLSEAEAAAKIRRQLADMQNPERRT